jgi:hypothetical protein
MTTLMTRQTKSFANRLMPIRIVCIANDAEKQRRNEYSANFFSLVSIAVTVDDLVLKRRP